MLTCCGRDEARGGGGGQEGNLLSNGMKCTHDLVQERPMAGRQSTPGLARRCRDVELVVGLDVLGDVELMSS
eukprot:1194674-Prorocentrum_minimum.AAC.7